MNSTSIAGYDYDEESRTLSIRFAATGRRYDYQDVPPDAYDNFRVARSKGRHFNFHIRDHYPCRWVREGTSTPRPRWRDAGGEARM